MNSSPDQDPLQFLKSLWGPMGVPMTGMLAPTLDISEVEKRIADLKSVENWLNMNLSVLRLNIQGLEMQKITLSAMKQGFAGQPAQTPPVKPMAEAWWNVLQGQMPPGKDSAKDK